MNNKMAINTYLSKTQSKKQNKQNRSRVIDTENILMVATWEGSWGRWVKMVKVIPSNWLLHKLVIAE